MVDRAQVQRIGQVVQLREAQAAASAAGLRRAHGEHDAASTEREIRATERDLAYGTWQALLGKVRPDPELFWLGGAWLLERERDLDAQELDLEIAQTRLKQARENHAQALASEAAAKKICSKAKKNMEKYLDERQSMQLSDSILWRWRR